MSRISFKEKLESLINEEGIENGSDTPDVLLAEYLMDCLVAYEKLTEAREKWYGRLKVPLDIV